MDELQTCKGFDAVVELFSEVQADTYFRIELELVASQRREEKRRRRRWLNSTSSRSRQSSSLSGSKFTLADPRSFAVSGPPALSAEREKEREENSS